MSAGTTYKFDGVVNRAGNLIEGKVTPSTDATAIRRFTARRVEGITYARPKFLLHIQAVATPRLDGQGYEWTTNMYHAGK